jgi:hypothetical protein
VVHLNHVNSRVMALKQKNGVLAPPQTRKELQVLYGRVVRKISAMSPEERVATMIRTGIYTKSRKLTKQYGG